jgi:hypothetical protein
MRKKYRNRNWKETYRTERRTLEGDRVRIKSGWGGNGIG